MKQFFLSSIAVVMILVSGCNNSSNVSEMTNKQDVGAKATKPAPEAGYTLISEKIFQISKKDYKECFSGTWDMKVPFLVNLPGKDIRNLANDSINKIVNLSLEDTLDYENNVYEVVYDCDTSDSPFSNPSTVEFYSKLGKNTRRVLSLSIYVNYAAGGGGNGFGTNLYSFNIDIAQNKILLINDLFDNENIKKLLKYIIENVESPNESMSLDEDFNVFGNSEDFPDYGSIEYVGFRIENTSLILNYSLSYGRGNAINEIVLPLKDIKPFVNKKYRWLCEG
ncbi:MAG: hypothetical protein J7604_19195 [Sporocytophaga sp.]|uniref:hypothetical protein n=1 Tax=Sporocytophaga sp. TaxID=2231183 RepID=UPI001B2975B8|nr:hypothetical protein [Sporocytophaga sp.]MBO9702345.1 hypothetical protein [Sporocytophaga sp.]